MLIVFRTLFAEVLEILSVGAGRCQGMLLHTSAGKVKHLSTKQL